MTTIRVEAQMSPDDLLKAVGQLNTFELDGFLAQVLQLRAQRQTTNLAQREAELLLRINEGIPAKIRPRYEALKEKRDAELLSPQEHQELLNLVTVVENVQAQRLEALAELARLRKTTIRDLMQQLGIKTPQHREVKCP